MGEIALRFSSGKEKKKSHARIETNCYPEIANHVSFIIKEEKLLLARRTRLNHGVKEVKRR